MDFSARIDCSRKLEDETAMGDVQMGQFAQQLANDILVWVGFGTLVGLLAKAIMPGRDPGGAVATLVMGIVGTMMGCGIVSFFWAEGRVTPISWLGFVVGTGGSLLLLIVYRLLAGYWFVEGEQPGPIFLRRFRRRRKHALPREI
jgi:uncharacterized membrane protein YeaQ/YmgE (transglycosylase-associated protein family)